MTHAEQMVKLSHDIPGSGGGYTKEELVDLYRSANSIRIFAACELAEYEIRSEDAEEC